MPKKLSSTQIAYAVAEYKRGRSMKCVGKELGVSDTTILSYFKQLDIPRRPAGMYLYATPDLIDMAIAMRAEGKPWKEVEAHIGLTTNTMLYHIRMRKLLGKVDEG